MTDVNTLIDEITKRAEEHRAFVKKSSENIFAAVSESMKEHPLVFLSWTQYTPHFNDGDPCEFSVGEIDVFAEIDGEEIGSEWDGLNINYLKNAIKYRETGELTLDKWYVDNYGEQRAKEVAISRLADFTDLSTDQLKSLVPSVEWADTLASKLRLLPNEIFLDAFGDHVKIKLSAAGAEVEEYDHD